MASPQGRADPAPGAPPAFGTAPPVGPEVSTTTFVEAEKLVQFKLTDKDRKQAAASWRTSMAPLYERRNGPRKVALDDLLAPYSQWNPVLPGAPTAAQHARFIRSTRDPGALPKAD